MGKKKAPAPPATLPAGTYYIGDPCYVIPDAEWDGVLQTSGYFGHDDHKRGGIFQHRGLWYAAYSTRYGDGTYRDGSNRAYPVDSGTIGAVPVELAKLEDEEGPIFGCHLISFREPFQVSEHNGVIRIGKITIDTAESDNDEYDDEEEEDDGDD